MWSMFEDFWEDDSSLLSAVLTLLDVNISLLVYSDYNRFIDSESLSLKVISSIGASFIGSMVNWGVWSLASRIRGEGVSR